MKMLRLICISMLCLLVANAQPISCKEDTHCSEGYYCETQKNVCQECFRCQDFKRQPPKPELSNECIKTINRCGPCAEGFMNIYRNGIKGKCVVPELFESASGSHYVYVCLSAAVIGLLIVATFMYVIIKHTDVIVFRVIAYYNPVLGTSPTAETSVSPDALSPLHLLKYLLRFDKNLSNK